jgi:predicted dehydrogenase
MTRKNTRMTRREFLKGVAAGSVAVAGFPTIVRASALGKDGAVAASDRIVMAGIGFGMMGFPNMESLLEKPEVQWVAVCDLDDEPLGQARDIVDKKYGNKSCATYKDFRVLYARGDLDAVSIAVPDHWHALLSIAAAKAGLDVYGEKPLSHDLLEGRAMVNAVTRYGRVWQTGSWQRSVAQFHQAAELVRNGRLGKVHRIEVGLPEGHFDFKGTFGQETMGPPPAGFDYDFWLGPAPYAAYCPARVHMNWRWNLDYGGGQLLDWIGHHLDIAHWGMGWDYTGPVALEGTGEYPTTGIYNSPMRYYATATYADGTPVIIAGGHDEIRAGTKWLGERGWIWVNRDGIEAEPASLLRERIGPGEIHLIRSRDHYRNFIDSVKSRAPTIAPIEIAHRSASVGHLACIAIQTGRKIKWDPATEKIIGNPDAERLLGRAYRAPWRLDA